MSKLNSRKAAPDIKAGAPNKILLIFTAAMIIFGIIMVFDASVYVADQPPFNNRYHFLTLQIFWIIIALIPAIFIYFWDYRKIMKLSLPALAVIFILLIGVLVVGNEVNGSRRWLALGSDQIVIQPAEFAKPVFIMYLAGWLAKERQLYKSFKDALRLGFGQKLLQFSVILGSLLILIILEPDFSTTLVIAVTAFVMFLVSGQDSAHILGSVITSIFFVLLAGVVASLESYRMRRIQTLIELNLTNNVPDPTGAGYQMQQILIALGSGGFWGKGFGNSQQRNGYLVELTPFTDSISVIFLEELGFIGGIIFILAWLLFFYVGLQVARKAPDRQGQLLAIGITFWLSFQAFFHIAANVALAPLTGMPLPFVTYGGSGTIVAIVGMAILINISRFTTDKPNRHGR